MQGGGRSLFYVANGGQNIPQTGMLSPREVKPRSHAGPFFSSPKPQTPQPLVPSPSCFVGATPDARARSCPAWHDDGEEDVDDDSGDDIAIVDDEVVEDSDEDDIVGDDPEAARQDDLSLADARLYGRKTPQQRDELRQRIQRLNTEQGEEPAGLHGAIHGLREASKSQGDAQLAGTLQECLQALIDSSDKASSGGSVRFKPSQEEHGTAPSGSYTTIGVMLGGPDVNGKCLVHDILLGSPAHLVGRLKRGDVILQVDSQDVGTHNIVDRIKGSDLPGSSVSLRVARPGRKRPLDVTLLRATKESVDRTRQTFELISELAQHGGASGVDDDIQSPASMMEKDLHRRLVSLEQEKLQQEVVLQEKEASRAKLSASVRTLVAEFVSIVGVTGGEEGSSTSRRVPDGRVASSASTGTDMGALRDTVLKVGRATNAIEDQCSELCARVAGKLLRMDDRLKHLGDLSARVRQASTMPSAAARKLSDAATKLVQLQDKVVRYENELLELKQENSRLASQAETREHKISWLESRVQLQASTMTDSKLHEPDYAPSESSAEPGGPAVDNSAGESRRLVAEIAKLKEEMARQKQRHEDDINEREKSLSDLSSSLFAAQDRASASMSELVTLRMENLKLKEQAMENERRLSDSERQNSVEIMLLKSDLDMQTKTCKELEEQYMQVQQKYVEASQELTQMTREASARISESEEHKMQAASAQQTIDSLKELMRKESDQLQEARSALERKQDKLLAAEAALQATMDKFGASENLRKTLEEKLASSEQLRKNMEETFNRERHEGLLAIRERDSLKRHRNSLQLELEKFQATKEMELEAGTADHKEALEQVQRELDDKRRESAQAKRERDSVKAELDESRYVIGQLTSEVNDLRYKLNTGMSPQQMQQQQLQPQQMPVHMAGLRPAPLPKAQRSAPTQGHQGQETMSPHGEMYELTPGYATSQSYQPGLVLHTQEHHDPSPVGSAHSHSPYGSHHSQSPGAGAFPQSQQQQVQMALGQPEIGMGEWKGGGNPPKPVGVYSNRAGRLFAM